MGLKNGNAMFQRMMEWVLEDIPCANPYVDDIIVGSMGDTQEELLQNHERDIRTVLEKLKEHKLVVDPKKPTSSFARLSSVGILSARASEVQLQENSCPFRTGSCHTPSQHYEDF